MPQKKPFQQRPRLRRNLRRKRIGGVCAGLADYFGVSIVAIRLIFLFSLMFGGLGLGIYLALWMALPAEVDTPMPKVSPRLEKSLRYMDKQVRKLNRQQSPDIADMAQAVLDAIKIIAPHVDRASTSPSDRELYAYITEGLPKLLDAILTMPPGLHEGEQEQNSLSNSLLSQLLDARDRLQATAATVIDRDLKQWMDNQEQETFELRAWKQSLRPLMERIRERAGANSIQLLEGIEDKLGFLLRRLDSNEEMLDLRPFEVRKIAFEYLPDTLNQYIHLPVSLSQTELLHTGSTADEALHEQLQLLDNTLHGLAKSLFERDAAGLLVHGRFLKEKFADHSFSLEGSLKETPP